MTQPIRHTIEPHSGFRSREVGLFVAQMDDQSRRMTADTRGLTAEQLAWQSALGMNTIGMLLAHIAVVEVFWTRLVLEDQPMPFETHARPSLGRPGGLPVLRRRRGPIRGATFFQSVSRLDP